MLKILLIITIIYIVEPICSTVETKLASKKFQQLFINEMSKHFEILAKEELNEYLKEIKLPENINNNYRNALQQAIDNDAEVDGKCLYIKQWLDVVKGLQQQDHHHHQQPTEILYILRNVNFLGKLKKVLNKMREDSVEEMHNLRYYQMCSKFKFKHNDQQQEYYATTHLQPFMNDTFYQEIYDKYHLAANQTININLVQFGDEVYGKVKSSGAEIIDDYLQVIKQLLLDIMQTNQMEENGLVQQQQHSVALEKILNEIDILLNISDFYAKRQHLYDYLQNHLTVDFELMHSSEQAELELLQIYNKFKQKGMDLVATFLFSNFEFLEALHQQWSQLIPAVAPELFNAKSRLLRQVELLYEEFKADVEDSNTYERYLQASKELYEQAKADDMDLSHIYELFYSAVQNIGALRINIIAEKCRELYER